MTMDEAVCIEPISVAYRGCVKAGISKHSKVLISGCGEYLIFPVIDFLSVGNEQWKI